MYYGTIAGADAYFVARGYQEWSAYSLEDKEAALTRASVYIDTHYVYMSRSGASVSMFSGTRTGGRAQERQWPRTGAVDTEGSAIAGDEVPDEVLRATYEAAAIEVATPGATAAAYVPSAQVKREKVGPLEVEYAESSADGAGRTPNSPVYPLIDGIIAPVLSAIPASAPVLVV